MPFDLDAQAAVDRMLASIRAHIEQDVRARTDELLAAAAAERSRASDEAVEAAKLEAERKVEASRNKAEAEALAARERAAAEVADARHRAQTLVQEVQLASDQRLADVSRERDDIRRELEESRRSAIALAADLDAVRRDRDGVRHALQSAQTEIARTSLEPRRPGLDQSAERAREWRAVELSRLQSIAQAVRSLDEAASLGDVLDRLAQGAARIADRAAVFVVQGDTLQAWRSVGFGGAGSVRGAELASHSAGSLGAAVLSGRVIQGTIDGQTPPPFAVSPAARHFAALPLAIGGVVVAAVYGDVLPASQAPDDQWPVVLELVTRHASRVLETVTLQHAGFGTGRPSTRPVSGAQGGSS